MELEARIATYELAETFVISRESSDEDDVVQVELNHEGVTSRSGGIAHAPAMLTARIQCLSAAD